MIGSRILQQLSSMQLRGIDLTRSWKLVSNAVPGVRHRDVYTTVVRGKHQDSNGGEDNSQSSTDHKSVKKSLPTDDPEKSQRDFRMAGRTTARSLSVAAKKRAMSSSDDGKLREAAVNAAKMISKDWSRTANTLLDRLNRQNEPKEELETKQPKEDVAQPPSELSEQDSLLKTMFVGRSINRESVIEGKRSQMQRYKPEQKQGVRSQGRDQQMFPRRQSDSSSGLFSRRRLGIFAEGESLVAQEVSVLGQGLWEDMEKEKLKTALGGLPHNAFEEQIEMTQKGMLWSFPINNEEDMHEERKYKFNEHIFLEKHLSQFPKTGPIRKFMELVCVGLSKNPWYTVPEKLEHIQWYADYFREKQSLLEKSIENKNELMGKRQASVEQ